MMLLSCRLSLHSMIIENLFPFPPHFFVCFFLPLLPFSGQNRGNPSFKVKKVTIQDQGTRLQCLSCKNGIHVRETPLLPLLSPMFHYLAQFTTANLIQVFFCLPPCTEAMGSCSLSCSSYLTLSYKFSCNNVQPSPRICTCVTIVPFLSI